MSYILGIIIADITSLRNRGLMYGIISSPYIATTFAGPSAAQDFLDGSGWRWGYGTFAIVTPVMCMPFLVVYYLNIKKAKDLGVREVKNQHRTILESIKYWIIELDGKYSVLHPPRSN